MAKVKVKKEKKMAKTTTSKIKKPSMWRNLLGRKINLWIAVVAVLAAGGAGVYYNRKSHALDAGTGCTNYALSVGSGGTCVRYMQGALDALYAGYNTGIDGQFGPDTKKLVMSFQNKINNLLGYHRLDVDGIVGQNTWYFICRVPGGYGQILPPYGSDAYGTYIYYQKKLGCYYTYP